MMVRVIMRDVQRNERYICYVAQGGWVSKGFVDNIDITSNFVVVVVLLSATDQVMYITRSLLTSSLLRVCLHLCLCILHLYIIFLYMVVLL